MCSSQEQFAGGGTDVVLDNIRASLDLIVRTLFITAISGRTETTYVIQYLA